MNVYIVVGVLDFLKSISRTTLRAVFNTNSESSKNLTVLLYLSRYHSVTKLEERTHCVDGITVGIRFSSLEIDLY